MGVTSDGSYGVERGLFFGFPTTVDDNGCYHIVRGLKLDEEAFEKLQSIAETLAIERNMAIAVDESLPAIVMDETTTSSESNDNQI